MYKIFIDTATQALIIILFKDDVVIDYLFDESKNNHSEKLMTSLETILKDNNLTIQMIAAFYVTEGPGSYTGVRIGVTVAKTLAYTLNKPLYKISSLQVIAASYINEAQFIVPIIDARRGNAFAACYEVQKGQLINVYGDSLYNIEALTHELKAKNLDVLFVGIDSVNFKEIIKNPKAALKNDFKPEEIIKLAFEKVTCIHSFVPNYKRLAEAEINLYEKTSD